MKIFGILSGIPKYRNDLGEPDSDMHTYYFVMFYKGVDCSAMRQMVIVLPHVILIYSRPVHYVKDGRKGHYNLCTYICSQ